MNLLEVSRLSVENNENVVLKDLSFSFQHFRRVAIAGETGSGKTSLLKAIAGLVQPSSGIVLFEGKRVEGPFEKLLPGHPHIAYLSQHFELRNNYRLSDFMEMASKVGEAEAHRIYELCQIEHLLHRKTDQLSGGERQRTALARLLTTSPRLLLLDEPFSNLDGIHKQTLKGVINAIVEEGKIACMMVSHDPLDVLPWAENLLVLKEGKIVQKGRPEEVYRRPVSEYTGGLLGEYNLMAAEEGHRIFSIGNIPKNKKLFIRPEKIKLQADPNGEGMITAKNFYGSYAKMQVEVNGVKLVVMAMETSPEKGERVKVAVTAEDVWYVD